MIANKKSCTLSITESVTEFGSGFIWSVYIVHCTISSLVISSSFLVVIVVVVEEHVEAHQKSSSQNF